MRRALPILGVAALLLCPGAAGAHSLLRSADGTVSYRALDATSLNTLTIEGSGADLRVHDATVDGGLDTGTCRPGQTDQQGYIVEAFCPLAGVARLFVDVGDREDDVTVAVGLPARVLGGTGADALTTGNVDDSLEGGDGNDRLYGRGGADRLYGDGGDDALWGGAGNDGLWGGAGADSMYGDDGDDYIDARDGAADTVSCGDGNDRVEADGLDQTAPDCETVTRPAASEPPATRPITSTPPPSADTKPPRLSVRATRLQRIGRSRRLRLVVTPSEAGTIAASGYLSVDGLRLALRSDRRTVMTAGASTTLTVRLGRHAMRQCLRAFRRHRRVVARLGVVATDLAGNSAKVSSPAISLRR